MSYFRALLEEIISGGIVAGDCRTSDRVLVRRMRVLNGASLGVLVGALSITAICAFLGLHDLYFPTTLTAVVPALAMWVARRGRLELAAHMQLITMLFTVTMATWMTGGADSPGAVFFVGLPLYAVFVLGVSAALAYVGVATVALTIFWICDLLGIVFQNIVPPHVHSTLYLWDLMVMGLALLAPASAFVIAQKDAEEKLLAANADLEAANAELARSRDLAESATRAKSAFLATMSHEIRTPINGIVGMTQLLLDTSLNNAQRDYAGTIRASSNALLAIINDVLDFSKIEAGKLDVESIDMDLYSSLEEVGSIMAFHALEKNLELIIDIEPTLPRIIKGDPQRLRQCLLNLVSNAIKFSHAGEIVVSAQRTTGAEGAALLRVEVRDSGAGIAPDVLSKLFQPFVQADSSTTRQFGGTGLGLSIVRRLVDLMSGEVGAHSELHRGSTFWFTLPISGATEGGASDRPIHRSERILVVHDNAALGQMLVRQLEHVGFEVTLATRADEAVASMQRAVQEWRPFAVLITDHHLPGMTGAELSDRIHSHPELWEAHIILLTSMAAYNELTHVPNPAVASYLRKPVRTSELISCLDRVLGSPALERRSEPQPSAVRTLPASQRHHGSKVLLIEDNPVNQKVAQRLLERTGCEVVIANDGADGVAKYQREPFHLVLMDIQMPIMDGYAATQRIRESEGGRQRTPIIALTADVLSDQSERCAQAGMDDFLTKPLDVDRLRDVLDRFLAGRSDAAPVPQEHTLSASGYASSGTRP